jgi:hypothetical protein
VPNGIFQFDIKRVIDVEAACRGNQTLRKLGIDAPVALFIGIRQCAARYPTADTQVIELGLMCAQTDFNIAQTLTPRELGESHAQELVKASKSLHVAIATELADKASERVHRQMLQELRENEAAFVHGDAPEDESVEPEANQVEIANTNKQSLITY